MKKNLAEQTLTSTVSLPASLASLPGQWQIVTLEGLGGSTPLVLPVVVAQG